MRHPILEEDCRSVAASGLPFKRLAGRTLLVTGAAGFVPAAIVEALLFLNETRGLRMRVVGTCRELAKGRRRFAHYRGRADLRLIAADAARPLRLAGPVHHILHAASQASPKRYVADPVGTLAPNALGTACLLELARSKKASLLFFSSCEAYGGALDPLDARACYSESKRMGETMCAAWHRQHGVRALVARIFHTYGPGMALDDGRAFADFVADAAAGRDIAVFGDGKAVRSYSYVADTAAGCLTVLLKGEPATGYDVGNDAASISVLGLARRIAGLFPEKRIAAVRKPRPKSARYVPSPFLKFCPDLRRLRALGFRPSVGLDEGFRRTVAYYS